MTGLGFCGHSHNHDKISHNCSIATDISFNQVIAPQACCHGHDHETDGQRADKFHSHCNCLGGFIGEISVSEHCVQIPLQEQIYIPTTIYLFCFSQQLERPPQVLI
ncbi:hypothetical protein KAR48_10735 [bacterium]|nr:hypothetical protein [bacterium]